MRFLAVIPCYNAEENIADLLKSVLKHGFDEVFVLDDASTDGSVDIVKSFGGRVTLIESTQNLGPAGNRNRILQHMRTNDILCFIDADMELLSGDFRSQVNSIFEQETTVGIIGGLVFSKSGDPMTFNYGYFANPLRDFIGATIELMARALPFLRGVLQPVARPFTYNVAIRYGSPTRQFPDWVSEAFCVMRGDVFREVGGFDASLRYHEGQVIARQFYQSGFRVLFYPEIHARHLEIVSRPQKRTAFTNWFKLFRK